MKFMLLAAGSNMRLLGELIFYSLAALFGLALLGLVVSEGVPVVVILAFVVLLAVFLGAPLYERYVRARVRGALRMLESLIDDFDPTKGELRFKRPIRFRPIVFNAVGRRIWASHGPAYSSSRRVEPTGDYVVA
ncbi:MAG: hypothetical protein ACXQTZ_03115, partial [Candidatus Alkanophagales archaeon]